ncbi:class I SAM-dependent methyltransferase [Lachnospiraceae bacterium 62-35]
MHLSERLRMVASFVPEGSRLIDVGTDHGYLPIYLAKQRIIGEGLAVDVRPGPLERAVEHIREYGLETRINTRLSDGLKEIKEEDGDVVVMAGMGGGLVIRIMEEGRHMWPSVRHWILSPQSDLHRVRGYLREQGFAVEREDMLLEDGKYYTVMKAGGWGKRQGYIKNGKKDRGKRMLYDYYGEELLRKKSPVLFRYLEKEHKEKEAILKKLRKSGASGERAAGRVEELIKELELIKEAQNEMQ